MKQYERYIKNVLSGGEVVCEFARLAVTRHLSDLKKKRWPFEFVEAEADFAIMFFESLKHTSGSLGGKPFNLQDNQAFILAMLFGWRRKDGGKRRFTQCYMEMARKAGKSEFAAAIQIYTGFFEGVDGAQVYTAATTRDQANMVFRAAKKMCRRLRQDYPDFRRKCEVQANSINYSGNDGFIQKVSADAGTLDGLNPHNATIDEYHAHKTDEIKGVMQTGMAGPNPLLVIITTAGFAKEYPCYRVERTNAINILKGEKTQDNVFAIIFTLDEGDDWQDERVWKKANPNLGSTPPMSYLREQVQDALNKGSSTRVQVLTKNFNIWMDAPKVWIPEEQIKAVMRPIDISEFEGRVCFTGLDLSATSDITALSLFSPPTYDLPAICKTFFWLPEETVKRRGNDVPYRDWTENGYIFTTPGNSVDYAAVRAKAYELYETLKIHTLTYDQWNSTESIADFEGSGMNTLPCRAYYSYMSPPTKKIEWMVGNGEVQIDENPVMLWMFRNIVLDRDSQDNIKPNKAKSAEKIDGVAAMAYSMYGWLFNEGQPATGSYLFDKNESLITF